MSSLTYRGHR